MGANVGDSMTDTLTTPFGFSTTAAEVVEGIDLTGRRAIVTGASSGIGVETARALACAGADVTSPSATSRPATAPSPTSARAPAATTCASRAWTSPTWTASRAFAAAWDEQLDILVNNAGVMAIQELTRSPQGWEMQFAVNHMGHFALALGLHGALAASGSARIVSLSSSGHLRCPVVFDDLHFRFRPYEPFQGYGQSKTANVLFAVEATRRWADDGITANAVMPGGIHTNLQRHVGGEDYINRLRHQGGWSIELKTAEQGAATSVLVAASPQLEGIGGRYFEDCREAEVVDERTGPRASPATRSTRRTPSGSGTSPWSCSPLRSSKDGGLRLQERARLHRALRRARVARLLGASRTPSAAARVPPAPRGADDGGAAGAARERGGAQRRVRPRAGRRAAAARDRAPAPARRPSTRAGSCSAARCRRSP